MVLPNFFLLAVMTLPFQVWASAAEGAKLAQEITNMVEEIRALGPLHWPTAPDSNGHVPQLEIQPELEEVAA